MQKQSKMFYIGAFIRNNTLWLTIQADMFFKQLFFVRIK